MNALTPLFTGVSKSPLEWISVSRLQNHEPKKRLLFLNESVYVIVTRAQTHRKPSPYQTQGK